MQINLNNLNSLHKEFLSIVKLINYDTTAVNTHNIKEVSIANEPINLNEINKMKDFNKVQKFLSNINKNDIKLTYKSGFTTYNEMAYQSLCKLIISRWVKTRLSKIYEVLTYDILKKKHNVELISSNSEYDKDDLVIDYINYDLKVIKLINKGNIDIEKLINFDYAERKKIAKMLTDGIENDDTTENKFFIVTISRTNNIKNIVSSQIDFEFSYVYLDVLINEECLDDYHLTVVDKNGNDIEVYLIVDIVD